MGKRRNNNANQPRKDRRQDRRQRRAWWVRPEPEDFDRIAAEVFGTTSRYYHPLTLDEEDTHGQAAGA